MNLGIYKWSGLARFASADTIVPDPNNPQSFNRYSYVENSPINFSDPTGHCKNGRGTGPGTCQVIGEIQTFDEEAAGWAIARPEVRAALDAQGITDEDAPRIRRFAPYRPVPDAYGVGGAKSVRLHTPFVSAEASIGAELTLHRVTHETTLFTVGSFNLHIGFEGGFINAMKEVFSPGSNKEVPYSTSNSLYVASIGNVDNLATDYAGPFMGQTTTVAVGPAGFVAGEAALPNELSIPMADREGAYSNIYGYANGYALTTDVNQSYYVPVLTYTPGQGFSSNPWPALQDLIQP